MNKINLNEISRLLRQRGNPPPRRYRSDFRNSWQTQLHTVQAYWICSLVAPLLSVNHPPFLAPLGSLHYLHARATCSGLSILMFFRQKSRRLCQIGIVKISGLKCWWSKPVIEYCKYYCVVAYKAECTLNQ